MATLRVITEREVKTRELLTESIKDLVSKGPHHDTLKAAVTTPSDNGDQDSMISALVKYIPVPVMTIYTLFDGIFRSLTPPPTAYWLGCFLLLCVFTIIIAYKTTKAPTIKGQSVKEWLKENEGIEDKVKTAVSNWKAAIDSQVGKQIVVAFIAFIAYVMAIGGPFTTINTILPSFVWQGYYGTTVLGFVTLIIFLLLPNQ